MFQIKDDILDVTSSAEVMGKNTGKDERDDKSTFVTLLGLEGAVEKLKEEYDSAVRLCNELKTNGLDTSDYIALCDYLYSRDR